MEINIRQPMSPSEFSQSLHPYWRLWLFMLEEREALNMNEYKKRVIDDQLKEKLECKGAVLIEGPKWCGKTTAS